LPREYELGREVVRNSGGDSWGKIGRLRFTFVVEVEGKRVMWARHDWDLVAGTDVVTWPRKEGGEVTATIRPGDPPPTTAPAEERAAYQRWTNDSYWLLMPLKLLDPGVNRTLRDPVSIGETWHEVLELSFGGSKWGGVGGSAGGAGGVGMTPGDRYYLYIAPAKSPRVQYWDYIPSPERKTRFSWERYEQVGPLTLSMLHRTDDGKRVVRFEEVSVEMKGR
jgi:hypothetical protein